MSVTLIIVAITCVISFIGFSSRGLINDLIFYPPAIANRNQWYRFITNGFIHADILHLLFNMYAFYLFGGSVEATFIQIFGTQGRLIYPLMYITALAACLLPTYFKQKENYQYRSLGASGAVSAVIFAFIFISPLQGISLIFIPIPIPGFIFGPLFLLVSSLLAKRGDSNVNHSAHFWGAVYGIVFLIVTSLVLSKYDLVSEFIDQVKSYRF